MRNGGNPARVAALVLLGAGCRPPAASPPATPDPNTAALQLAREEIDRLHHELEGLRSKNTALGDRLAQTARESDELVSRLMEDLEARDRTLQKVRVEAGGDDDTELDDVIQLANGRELSCRILQFEEGVYRIRLPGNQVRKVRAVDISRIRFRAEPPELEAVTAVAPHTEPAAAATPPPPPRRPTPAPKPEETRRQYPSEGLALSHFWEMPVPAGSQKIHDLRRIFSRYGQPEKDLAPDPSIWLYQDVHYLMPRKAAEAALHLKPTRKNPMEMAGIPNKSFFVSEYEGAFEQAFDRLFLVTDMKDQVVAVQLTNDQPASRRQSHEYRRWQNLFSERSSEWHLFNLVEGKAKGLKRAQIAFNVGRVRPGVIGVDSEYWSSGRELSELTLLFVPQPVVDLILYLIHNVY